MAPVTLRPLATYIEGPDRVVPDTIKGEGRVEIADVCGAGRLGNPGVTTICQGSIISQTVANRAVARCRRSLGPARTGALSKKCVDSGYNTN